MIFFLVMTSLVFSLSACKKKRAPVEPPIEQPSAPGPTGTMETPPPVERPTEEGPMMGDIFEEVTKQLQPVFYEYNMSDIREDQIAALQNNARVLKQNADVSVLVEGHCDERGTDEYNLALGERRAQAAKEYLVSLGIPETRLNTISYGESRPFAPGHDEQSWSQNRRAHFVAVKK